MVAWTHGKFEKNELGGSHITHARRGSTTRRSEPDAFERARRFLSYLPNLCMIFRKKRERRSGECGFLADRSRAPRPARSTTCEISRVVDQDSLGESFFETGKLWAVRW